ncbi:MAG: ATP-grasp domain-containing protein [Candidatus Moraniibacteriota bacterium]
MKKNQAIIKEVVEAMGGIIEKIIPERRYFCININNEKIFISRKFEIASDFISGKMLTSYKDLTYVVLKKNNLPTPNSVCFYKKTLSASDTENKLRSLSYPIVIKDSNGSNSKGVFTNIKNIGEAKEIILREIDKFKFLIAQEMIFGKEYRVLILGNEAIGVLEMTPPRISGDGKSTVQKLIEKKQLKKYKKTNLDSILNTILKDQEVGLDTVLKKNQEIFIKGLSCLAEGGETRDMTNSIHPEIKEICARASRATGKTLAGIDLICDDITLPPDKQKISILEINGKPDIYIHYNPTQGETQNVVKKIIDYILKLKTVSVL